MSKHIYVYLCIYIYIYVRYIYIYVYSHYYIAIISFVKKLQKNRFTESKYVPSYLFSVIFQIIPLRVYKTQLCKVQEEEDLPGSRWKLDPQGSLVLSQAEETVGQ